MKYLMFFLCVLISMTPTVAYPDGHTYAEPAMTTVETKVQPQATPKYREIVAEVTAFNEHDGHTPGTIMANEKHVHYGAVANDSLPLGTVVEINGKQFVVVDKFGGGYGEDKFDMYLPTVAECYQWGVRRVTVKIFTND